MSKNNTTSGMPPKKRRVAPLLPRPPAPAMVPPMENRAGNGNVTGANNMLQSTIAGLPSQAEEQQQLRLQTVPSTSSISQLQVAPQVVAPNAANIISLSSLMAQSTGVSHAQVSAPHQISLSLPSSVQKVTLILKPNSTVTSEEATRLIKEQPAVAQLNLILSQPFTVAYPPTAETPAAAAQNRPPALNSFTCASNSMQLNNNSLNQLPNTSGGMPTVVVNTGHTFASAPASGGHLPQLVHQSPAQSSLQIVAVPPPPPLPAPEPVASSASSASQIVKVTPIQIITSYDANHQPSPQVAPSGSSQLGSFTPVVNSSSVLSFSQVQSSWPALSSQSFPTLPVGNNTATLVTGASYQIVQAPSSQPLLGTIMQENQSNTFSQVPMLNLGNFAPVQSFPQFNLASSSHQVRTATLIGQSNQPAQLPAQQVKTITYASKTSYQLVQVPSQPLTTSVPEQSKLPSQFSSSLLGASVSGQFTAPTAPNSSSPESSTLAPQTSALPTLAFINSMQLNNNSLNQLPNTSGGMPTVVVNTGHTFASAPASGGHLPQLVHQSPAQSSLQIVAVPPPPPLPAPEPVASSASSASQIVKVTPIQIITSYDANHQPSPQVAPSGSSQLGSFTPVVNSSSALSLSQVQSSWPALSSQSFPTLPVGNNTPTLVPGASYQISGSNQQPNNRQLPIQGKSRSEHCLQSSASFANITVGSEKKGNNNVHNSQAIAASNNGLLESEDSSNDDNDEGNEHQQQPLPLLQPPCRPSMMADFRRKKQLQANQSAVVMKQSRHQQAEMAAKLMEQQQQVELANATCNKNLAKKSSRSAAVGKNDSRAIVEAAETGMFSRPVVPGNKMSVLAPVCEHFSQAEFEAASDAAAAINSSHSLPPKPPKPKAPIRPKTLNFEPFHNSLPFISPLYPSSPPSPFIPERPSQSSSSDLFKELVYFMGVETDLKRKMANATSSTDLDYKLNATNLKKVQSKIKKLESQVLTQGSSHSFAPENLQISVYSPGIPFLETGAATPSANQTAQPNRVQLPPIAAKNNAPKKGKVVKGKLIPAKRAKKSAKPEDTCYKPSKAVQPMTPTAHSLTRSMVMRLKECSKGDDGGNAGAGDGGGGGNTNTRNINPQNMVIRNENVNLGTAEIIPAATGEAEVPTPQAKPKSSHNVFTEQDPFISYINWDLNFEQFNSLKAKAAKK